MHFSALLLFSLKRVYTNLLTDGLVLSAFCWARPAMNFTFGLGSSPVCRRHIEDGPRPLTPCYTRTILHFENYNLSQPLSVVAGKSEKQHNMRFFVLTLTCLFLLSQ